MAVTANDLRSFLIEIGAREQAVKTLDPAKPLVTQGIDSADYPAFVALLEERFGLDMDEAEGLALRTLDDFAAYINAKA